MERYYNTIKKGIDKNGKNILDFQCDTVFIYYLTMYKDKQPSTESIGELKDVKIIYYGNEIRNWISKCIQIIPKDFSLISNIIQQYLNLINRMTHNDILIDERIELKNKISKNWKNVKYLIENFKHIKWHTVYDFWTILSLKLKAETRYKNVIFFPNDLSKFEKTITELTHESKDTNHGVIFETDKGKKIYIASLGKLSWGIVEPKMWTNFREETLENISFSDFSTENTYRLIDKNNIEEAVDIILTEICEEEKNNFKNLNRDK